MRLKFWGVRGSIPVPGTQTVKYGGNTACVELDFTDSARRFIFDAGSGIRGLGMDLLTNGSKQADLFLTHTHLDHIIGFPFFAPLFDPEWTLNVYGPITCEEDDLKEVLGTQLSYRFFPVRQTELAADVKYTNLPEGQFDLADGIHLHTTYLNHPLLCLAYRIEYNGKVLCTAYDTEPFQNPFCPDPSNPGTSEAMVQEGDLAAAEANRRIQDFISGADILIYDAQYTASEYKANRIGWGHTAIEDAVSAARRAKVKRLILFHHDPQRSDEQIDELEKIYCRKGNPPELTVEFAREGMEVVI